MIETFGVARLGRDAELRYTQNGEPVTTLALAFNWGKRAEDGNRSTTWIDGSLWGKRAESLTEYLVKGKQVMVSLEDLHMETFQGRNGEAHKLVARVSQVELGAGGEASNESQQHPQYAGPAPSQQRRPQAPAVPPPQQGRMPVRVAPPVQRAAGPGASGFDDMDDDVPF